MRNGCASKNATPGNTAAANNAIVTRGDAWLRIDGARIVTTAAVVRPTISIAVAAETDGCPTRSPAAPCRPGGVRRIDFVEPPDTNQEPTVSRLRTRKSPRPRQAIERLATFLGQGGEGGPRAATSRTPRRRVRRRGWAMLHSASRPRQRESIRASTAPWSVRPDVIHSCSQSTESSASARAAARLGHRRGLRGRGDSDEERRGGDRTSVRFCDRQGPAGPSPASRCRSSSPTPGDPNAPGR